MLDFSRFELLTFDCYGTLIDWETGIFSALKPVLTAHGKSIPDATLLELYGEFEAEAESGTYRNYREVLQSVVQAFGTRLSFVPTAMQKNSLPDAVPTWRPWPDTVSALKRLASRYRLAIISNIDDDLFATTGPKLKVEFDQVITAEQAGAYKPSLKPFQLAIQRLELDPKQILHVGQSLYHDTIPAQSLGMGTVWVNRVSRRPGVGAVKKVEATPDLQVSDLRTLAAAIFPG